MWACVYRRRGNFHERSTHVFHGLNNFQEILFFADGCDHEIFEPNINFVFKRSRTCKWPKQLRRRLSAYRRRTNFCGHNILCVKFSWGQIFMGGGSPWKFNPHKTIVVHETRMARREEDVKYQKMLCDKVISLRYRRWGYPRWQWTIRNFCGSNFRG